MMSLTEKVKRFGSVSKLAVDLAFLKYVKKAHPKTLGKFTQERFSKMGPTFIKIGQFISTRADIFGSDFSNELKGLQDKIDPFTVDINVLDDLYQIDHQPIATASIGQVYKGHLAKNNMAIAIKAKRPNIENMINADFEAFLLVVDIANKLSNQREVMELNIIVNEYYKLLQEEVNFHKEVENMIAFKKMFAEKNFVKIPQVYPNLSNNEIIVMEYVPAIRIDDIQTLDTLGFNRKKIAEKLVELFLDQIINHGVIHIDPHPGNLGITENGKIVFYDYGMVQNIGIDFKRDLKDILLAVYEKNVEYLCQLFIQSKIVIVEKSKLPYLKNFVLVFLNYVDNLDIDEFKKMYIDKVDQRELPFTISSKFLLILRGISILEGVCKSLDSSFSYRNIIENYIDESIVDFEYIERKAIMDIDNMRAMPDKLVKNQIQLEMIEKNMERIETKSDPNNIKTMTLISLMLAFDVIDNLALKSALAVATYVLLNK